MAITLVASAGAASSDDFNATTAAVDDTGATLDIIGVGYGGATSNMTVSDSKGNAYDLRTITATNSGDINAQISWFEGPIVGSGHTGSALAVFSKPFPCVCFAAFAGVDFQDLYTGATDNGLITSIQTGPLTPTLPGSLLFTTIALRGFAPGQTFFIDSGFTILHQFPGDGVTHVPTAFACLIQGASATVNPTWSWTGADTPATNLMTFSPILGGGGGGNPWYYYAQQRVKTELSRVWNRRGPLWVPDYAMRTKVA
jgi:hypothetical protein